MDLCSESVIPRFHALVEATPDRPFLTFVGDDGREEAGLTPRALSERATRAAGALLDAGLSRGDRVVLAYPPGLEFVVGLLGSMMAGLIPVPVAPPHPLDPGAELARFAAMVESCGARVALTDQRWLRARRLGQARDAVVGLVKRGRSSWPELTWYATESLRGGAPPRFEAGADDVALLQYTSGSTAAPRGVMITHGNLAHQLACNAAELGLDRDSRCVCWLPHFHDFGLISGILSALRGNGRLTLLSPLTFIRRPAIWLELLSAERGTHTAAPNFAYDLVVRKTTPAQRAGWDLSALRVAMSAAEPVREEVIEAFCAAFAASGFRPDAFVPAYGLAEHTVGVSVAGKARVRVDRRALEVDGVARPSADPAARPLVGCGRPSAGVEVRVVDPETGRALGEARVGELWVDSPSKAAGYWGLPGASRETFEAELSPPDGRRWLRTGDLGFLLDGELYVTGRLKDLIIVRGRNVYPQDIEESVRLAHAAIRPGGIAAFAVDDGGTERVVVLVEAREKKPSRVMAEEMAKAVRRAVAEDHQLACDVVAVMEPGGVLKTTSGKVRRRACRQAWEGGTLAGIAHRIDASVDDPVVPALVDTVAEHDAPDLSARTEGLAPSFAALVARASRYLVGASQGGEKRPGGVAATGTLHVEPAPELPAHRFFAAGRAFPVLLRHDNRTVSDDAAQDARVASLRVLGTPDDLDSTRLDLALLTGRCFFHRTAEDFFRFSVAPPAAREALLRAEPHRSAAAWEGIREATGYDRYHYHSQTVTWFVAADGARYYARYRLRSPDRPEDEGFVAPDGLFPATAAPRREGDTRTETCLRDAFAARLAAGPVGYVLEVQVVPVPSGTAENETVLDCTRPWDAPWRHLASVRLDRPVDAPAAAALEVNPVHAPRDLGVVYARDERSSASIDHVRTIVYEVSARTRLGRPLSPGLAALLAPAPVAASPAAPVAPPPAASPVAPSPAASPVAPSPAASPVAPSPAASPRARVAVVGAGASGLTLARALERRGYTVVVFERDPQVGGMCQTRTFDGVTCDLGGHMIFPAAYPTIVGLAREHGLPLVPDFPDVTIDPGGRVLPKLETPALRAARQRVARILGRTGAAAPGLPTDPSLAVPVAEWIDREALAPLWAWMGPIFVAAGYGHLEDQIPAVYLAKSFAHTQDEAGRYQLAGGFQALWERVAAGLQQVRVGTEVVSATRDDTGVTVTSRGPEGLRTERFDRLVIAHTPAAALGWLDSTDEERRLFGRVRHLPYISAYAVVEDLPEALRGRWCFMPENTQRAARRGHVASFVQPDPSRPVVAIVAYAAPEQVDPVERFAEDFARLGGRLVRMLHHQQWRYFPHFSADDVAGGALTRAEALQGQRRTWHASTLFSFELTECAAAYAETVAARMDAELRGAGAFDGDAQAFAVFREAVRAETERVVGYLQRVASEELERPVRDPDASLAELGLDSLRAVSLHQRIRHDAGMDLPITLLTEATSLRAVAETIVRQVVAPAAPAAPTDDDDVTRSLLAELNELEG